MCGVGPWRRQWLPAHIAAAEIRVSRFLPPRILVSGSVLVFVFVPSPSPGRGPRPIDQDAEAPPHDAEALAQFTLARTSGGRSRAKRRS